MGAQTGTYVREIAFGPAAYRLDNVGFMHNGYGSGDVEIRMNVVPLGPTTDDGATAFTVAGNPGTHPTHRRITGGVDRRHMGDSGLILAIQDLSGPPPLPRTSEIGFRRSQSC